VDITLVLLISKPLKNYVIYRLNSQEADADIEYLLARKEDLLLFTPDIRKAKRFGFFRALWISFSRKLSFISVDMAGKIE